MDLKAFRETRGLTQQQVADELGLKSKAYVSQIEAGVWTAPIKLALRIEHWSGGKVRAVELLTPDDAQLLRAAIERPEPAGASA